MDLKPNPKPHNPTYINTTIMNEIAEGDTGTRLNPVGEAEIKMLFVSLFIFSKNNYFNIQ